MTVSCTNISAGMVVFFYLGGAFISSFFAYGFGEAAYLTIPPPSIWQLISIYPMTGGTFLSCMVTFTFGFFTGVLSLLLDWSFILVSVLYYAFVCDLTLFDIGTLSNLSANLATNLRLDELPL
jgi:hypothetical protein